MRSIFANRLVVRGAVAALLALPAGCDIDPWNAPGTWQAGTTNEQNLITSVANKHDLVEGVKMHGSDAQLDAAAIDRLHSNTLKPLSVSTTSPSIAPASGGSN